MRLFVIVSFQVLSKMGNSGSKVNFRKAVIELTTKRSKGEEDTFWEELWASNVSSAADIFALVPAEDVSFFI